VQNGDQNDDTLTETELFKSRVFVKVTLLVALAPLKGIT